MTLTKPKIFLILCLGFIFGIFLGQYINYETMAILAMVFIIVATIGWHKKLAVVIGLTGLIILLGAVRFKQDFAQNDIAQFYGQNTQVTGVITEEPDVRSDKTYLTLSGLIVNGKTIKSKILVSTFLYPPYEYGDKLKFEEKISERISGFFL
ncbi:MAG: DUF4131 domain-containing protein [Candidatus Doudnabacteria bacterium]